MGRKRQKSSPCQTNINNPKKYKFPAVSEVGTEYFTADSDSESIDLSETLASQSRGHSDKLHSHLTKVMRFNRADIDELCDKLSPKLIQNLKSELTVDLVYALRNEFKDLIKQETQDLRDEVETLKSEIKNLKDELKVVKSDNDELNQYGRRMCLDISGIQGDTGSNTEDIESKILAEAKAKKIDICSADIDRCHRKGQPKASVNRKVIIKFTNSKARQRLYEGRKSLSSGIYVQENLTPYREFLSFEARKLKREGLATKCWVAGCKVFVQLVGENKSCQIKDMDTISNIRANYSSPPNRQSSAL